MTTADLIARLKHPKVAQPGDLVFVSGGAYPAYVEVAEILEITLNGYLRLTGQSKGCRRTDLPPVTEKRIASYLESLRLLAMPVVTGYRPLNAMSVYPESRTGCTRVVGREECEIAVQSCTRSPSNYVDTRVSLTNRGFFSILLREYNWEDSQPRYESPFAYVNDVRQRVFSVYGHEKLWSGQTVEFRVCVSSWAPAGKLSLYLPSGLFGGAIGTYTSLIADVPEPIEIAEVVELTEADIVQ